MSRIDDLKELVVSLETERYGADGVSHEQIEKSDDGALFAQFRALVNTREPIPASEEFLEVQDRVLQSMIEDAGVADADGLPRVPLDSRLSLWRGDITTIRADAIVNAANSQMLGCWVPGHHCIDNAIHTFAGVQLRLACAEIMRRQEHDEPTGQAKVTPAFNLPSGHVIHTVGPIANGRPTQQDRRLLAMSYLSCLDAAEEMGCDSIAFCCISTGVFGFPQRDAAEIALSPVRHWLDEHESDMHVVFNVFTEEDERIYHELLFDE